MTPPTATATRHQERTARANEIDRAIASRQAYESHELARRSADQSDIMRKVTCWAAVLVAPTAVGTVYGMNFEHMPELHWQLGYPAAVAAMIGSAAVILVVFRAKRWL